MVVLSAPHPCSARTVGSALPETEVKIVDPEGRTVETGTQGELCARGYLIMQGYDAEPEATARAILEKERGVGLDPNCLDALSAVLERGAGRWAA